MRINNEQLKHYFDFLWAMTEKEIKTRYKRTVFGFLWVILNPLLQMVVIGLIFSFFIKINDYFLFIFVGLLVWTFFSLSITKATPSIVYERSLLQKAKFPIEAIPISIILANFFHMLVSFALLFVILLPLGKVAFPNVLLLIPAFFWILVVTIGISLLFSSLNVRFRDINFFVQTLVLLWFYVTPVLYNLSLVPLSTFPIFTLNPLTSIFELLHISLLDQGVLDDRILIVNLVVSLLVVLIGLLIFHRERRYFVDWL